MVTILLREIKAFEGLNTDLLEVLIPTKLVSVIFITQAILIARPILAT